jgi:hypothetical protein
MTTTLEWIDRVIAWKAAGIDFKKAKEIMEALGPDTYTKDYKTETIDYHRFVAAWDLVFK